MKKSIPLFLMLTVLVAPFAVSMILLSDRDNLGDRARGEWLSENHYVNPSEDRNWQVLWRQSDCKSECEDWFHLLRRLKMALGKRQDQLTLVETEHPPLLSESNGLFIADHSGLVLLSYEATQDGAYKLLKDLKTLMKHGGA